MIHDVIIIGAGPCGLATAARLREKTPSALFTDAEHARYWYRYKKTSTIEKETRRGRRQHNSVYGRRNLQSSANTSSDTRFRSMLVLDATSDEWLSAWQQRFRYLEIDYLRSPLFFHCDPRDRDALLEYSHAEGRTKELKEINNVVGREASKHQKKKIRKKKLSDKQSDSIRHLDLDNRDQTDYHTPSSALFHDCSSRLIERYRLCNVVQKAKVTSIRFGHTVIPTEPGPIFTLTSDKDQIFLAKSVVIAAGAGIPPSIPSDYKFLRPHGSVSHVFDRINEESVNLLPAHVRTKIQSQEPRISIAIVGGGLTSIQLINLLLSQTKQTTIQIHLIMRSKLKIKHFDVDLDWVSKLRNRNMAMFWSAETDDERFEMLKQSRNGGSVPPGWAKSLRQLEKERKVICHENTQIVDGTWSDESQSWGLSLETIIGPNVSHLKHNRHHHHDGCYNAATNTSCENLSITKTDTTLNSIHHVYFATGVAPNINNIDFLQDMMNDFPIPSIGGLPRIDNDLQWAEGVPMFLTGALAGLRLGPGAGNLAGARLGAERIAWALDNGILDVTGTTSTNTGSTESDNERDSKSSSYSVLDSAYASGSDDEAKCRGMHRRAFSDMDRSEFTGGFNNQFEALAS